MSQRVAPNRGTETYYSQNDEFTGTAKKWGIVLIIVLITLTGILAGLTIAVFSTNLTRLKVWTRVGDKQRRYGVPSGTTDLCGHYLSSRIRKRAQSIFDVRDRPNWLFISMILASTLVAEALPLLISRVSGNGHLIPLLISTLGIGLFGEIIPQAVMPLYVLEIGGRCIWFVKTVMWMMVLPALPLAFTLRKLKQWRNQGQSYTMDGILTMDELIEFIRLHEISEGLGGCLTSDTSLAIRLELVRQKAALTPPGIMDTTRALEEERQQAADTTHPKRMHSVKRWSAKDVSNAARGSTSMVEANDSSGLRKRSHGSQSSLAYNAPGHKNLEDKTIINEPAAWKFSWPFPTSASPRSVSDGTPLQSLTQSQSSKGREPGMERSTMHRQPQHRPVMPHEFSEQGHYHRPSDFTLKDYARFTDFRDDLEVARIRKSAIGKT